MPAAEGPVAAWGMLRGRARPQPHVLAVGLLAVGFLALTVWWISLDHQLPDFDNGRHLTDAWTDYDALRDGHVLLPFQAFNGYPPLVHLVGALGAFVTGVGVAGAKVCENLVFVPLLVAGSYGSGRAAFGSRGGVLAAMFALGTPMLVSQAHDYMLDVPETALVAVAVWLVLASDRFARTRLAGLAGLAVGLGMLTKQTFPIFVVGLLVVVLARGGWRHPRGLVVFAGVATAVAAPWYLAHHSELAHQAGAVTTSTGGGSMDPGSFSPPRWSSKNAGWYLWDLVNHQLLLPLSLLLAIGVVVSVSRYLRRPRKADLTPELIVGGLVAYLGMTLSLPHDPRYTLPALVYMAVLGGGWIGRLRGQRRVALGLGLTVIVVVNVAAVTFGVGSTHRVVLPGAPLGSPLGERQLTVSTPVPWAGGGAPQRGGDLLPLFEALRRDGIEEVEYDPVGNVPGFNGEGLTALARIAGLRHPSTYDPGALGPRDAFLTRRTPAPGLPAPCARLADGTGVYIVLGSPLRPPAQQQFYCPPRGRAA